jgi:hypothetical protein
MEINKLFGILHAHPNVKDTTRLLNVKMMMTTKLESKIKISFLYQYNIPRGPSAFYNGGAMCVV